MTMKRGIIVCSGFAGAVFAMWIITETSSPPCPINSHRAGEIKIGMTYVEIEEILGGPAGNYETVDANSFVTLGWRVDPPPLRSWKTDYVQIDVNFETKTDRVTGVNVEWSYFGWTRKIRGKLGLL